MLLQHARSQLDQGAKVQVQDAESLTMTSGVRMGSYFAICVRPQVGNAMAQARELHHIAQAIDLLRQGDLDLLGDVLAGRFMSLHQSVIDGSWATARHLELLPLEEGTAAGPEVVLEAKRHARLAAKLAPADQWNWGNSGKGKGGRGKASSWHDSYGVQKGKGKKGAKGKESRKDGIRRRGGGDSNSGEARGKMRRLEEQQGSLGYPDADPVGLCTIQFELQLQI